VGANFSSQVYTTAENIAYPSVSVTQLKADTVIHNSVYTRSIVTGGLDVAQRAQLNNGFDCQGNALFSQGIRCTAGTDSTEYSSAVSIFWDDGASKLRYYVGRDERKSL
jgi:hypothetical protein